MWIFRLLRRSEGDPQATPGRNDHREDEHEEGAEKPTESLGNKRANGGLRWSLGESFPGDDAPLRNYQTGGHSKAFI